MCKIRNGAIWLQINDFLCDGNRNVCSLSIYVIFAIQIKYQQFELELEGEGQLGENWNLHHSTGSVGFYVDDLFSEF